MNGPHYRKLELLNQRSPRHHPLTRYIPAPVLTQSFQRTAHTDALWYPEASLGLFVHWGISSVHGSIDLSWGMMADTPWQKKNKITANQYFALADRFAPKRYHPTEWLKTAKKAGMQYAVLTVRHEDGYTLWPSKCGTFGTHTHFDGVDLVRPFVDACRDCGLKVGFYYSSDGWFESREHMSFSYHSTGRGERPHLSVDHEAIDLPPKPAGWRKRINHVAEGQIRELLSNYGPIDLLWFSGGPEVISIDEIRQLQPGIVINSRMHGCGDFETPEGVMPIERPDDDIWWERSDMWDPPGWGFHSVHNIRSTGWILSLLAEVRSWHGNLLISWAPGPDGSMREEFYTRMAELERWMEHSGESIIDCDGGPYPENCNVPATTGNIVYLHFVSPEIPAATLTDVPQPRSVESLQTGAAVDFSYADRKITVEHPRGSREGVDEVVKVLF